MNNPPKHDAQQFLLRVNDLIEAANRLERRTNIEEAQYAFLQAFSRYSAYYYGSNRKIDTAAERKRFVEYIGSMVARQTLEHIEAISGSAPDVPAAG